jgi:MinD-like ATPase involved in chromosome partitioning or flagellar assembly
VADTVVVLVVAAGASWESAALGRLAERPGIVVLKRCVDVSDLLASASAGQAHVAVVGVDAPGLDQGAIDHLRGHGVRPVVILPSGGARDGAALRATRIGIRSHVGDDELDALPDVVAAGEEPEVTVARVSPEAPVDPPGAGGRVIAVWGPAGAPGRSTLAAGLAAEIARRGARTILVDADPYGGSIAQQLGIVDDVSGVLSAARAMSAGALAERFGGVQRSLDHRFSVVTGLPRGDRYAEVRPGVVGHLLEVAAEVGHVVVDTGFNLEDEPGSGTRPGRNAMTLAALEAADEVLVVGSADPVGLSRLARGLVELRESAGIGTVRVAVNRMRPTIGWAEKDIAGMVAGFTRCTGLYFLPDDRAAVDKALVSGRTIIEVGDTALGRAISGIAADLVPQPQAAKSR